LKYPLDRKEQFRPSIYHCSVWAAFCPKGLFVTDVLV
jgi:hypothetical protein